MLSILATLLPTIVGGVIALCGVGLTTHLSSRREDQKLRVSKFEELFELLSRQDEWANLMRRSVAFGEAVDAGPPPIQRAIAISVIYFPTLVSSLDAVDTESINYSVWMTEAAQRRLAGNWAAVNEGFKEAYGPYRRAVGNAHNELVAYASGKNGKV